MTITKRDIDKALENLDDNLRQDFLNMTDGERDTVLLSLSGSNSNRLANVEKKQIDMERDIMRYRHERERKEDDNDEGVMNITQKILKAIQQHEESKFNYWAWFRDRVLPTIVTIGTLALLALMFGQRIINP